MRGALHFSEAKAGKRPTVLLPEPFSSGRNRGFRPKEDKGSPAPCKQAIPLFLLLPQSQANTNSSKFFTSAQYQRK